jgi:hypothetical protein
MTTNHHTTTLAGIRLIDAVLLGAGLSNALGISPLEAQLRYYLASTTMYLLAKPDWNIVDAMAVVPHGIDPDITGQAAEYFRTLGYCTNHGQDLADVSLLHSTLQRGLPATLPAASREALFAYLNQGIMPSAQPANTELLAVWVLHHLLYTEFGEQTTRIPVPSVFSPEAISAVATHYGDLGWAIAVTVTGFTVSYRPIATTDPPTIHLDGRPSHLLTSVPM